MSWAWHLRPIAEADRDWAFALHRESLGDYVIQNWGWDETARRAMFDEGFERRRRQIIEIDQEAVGVLEIEQRPEGLYLALIELAAEWRERGLGSEIVGSLIAQAHSSGRPLSLDVLKANSRAISFYERLGLDIIEVQTLKIRLRTRRSTIVPASRIYEHGTLATRPPPCADECFPPIRPRARPRAADRSRCQVTRCRPVSRRCSERWQVRRFAPALARRSPRIS